MKIRQRICDITIFLCVIAYVLVGFYTKEWAWSLFIFILIPLMPFLLGLKRFYLWFELIVTVAYIFLGVKFSLWHPYWVLFLLIPIYHILFDRSRIKNFINKKKKEHDDDFISVKFGDDENEEG
jgi:hypothetical protein